MEAPAVPTTADAAPKELPRLLLHCCCAPCASYVLEALRPSFDLTCYFHNPNIDPSDEYERRLAEMQRLAACLAIPLVIPRYDRAPWRQAVRGHESQPEGGSRCLICYRFRLEATARYAAENGIPWFTSTLSVSPHKNARAINPIGQEIAGSLGLRFYSADFKKKDGFKTSLQISRQFGFYRQTYCGCCFSRPANSAASARTSLSAPAGRDEP